MGTRIFVGNLAYGSSESALRAHFEEAGFELRSARIISDRETGRSRGFGFVELVSDDCVRAIETLDGTTLDGRRLSIREAHERREGGPPRDGAARSPRREAAPSRVIVERVGGGEGRRGSSRAPQATPIEGEREAAGLVEAPEPAWPRRDDRRKRKSGGRRGRRSEDDDDRDW